MEDIERNIRNQQLQQKPDINTKPATPINNILHRPNLPMFMSPNPPIDIQKNLAQRLSADQR